MNKGYNFYFKDGSDVLTFPITPSELSISSGSNNKTITLINEGEINILKSPSLTQVSFDARFPMRQYPYAREFVKFETYWEKFKELKENKKSFRFIVARTTPNGSRTWDTNILVALEDLKIKESADEGDDVIISFTLKQFKSYGVKTVTLPVDTKSNPPSSEKSYKQVLSTSTSAVKRDDENKADTPETYTVKEGDCLYTIAQEVYGDGSKWKNIYKANSVAIESAAKKHGRQSSSQGKFIYEDLQLKV